MVKGVWTKALAVLAVACTLVLTACGGPTVEQLIREDVEAAFAEISPDNEELLAAMGEGADGAFDQLGIDIKEFAAAYLDGFDHTINEVSVDEEAGTAQVNVTVKLRSLSGIMAEFVAQFQEHVANADLAALENEEALYEQAGVMLMDAVKASKLEDVDCTFTYEKDGENTWSAAEGTEEQLFSAMM